MINNSTLTYINANSDYVKVNIDKIYSFLDNIDNLKYNYWLDKTDLLKTEKERIIFAFICESMNFCFWSNRKWIVKYKNREYHGSEALFYTLIKAIDESKLVINLKDLEKINQNQFESIMESDGELPPLINERYYLFQETIKIMNQKGEIFFEELFSLQSDEELLEYIVNNISHFDDKSVFKGKTIHFNKRAILLVNDLYNLSQTIRKNIKNVNNLTGCADYSIPRLLVAVNILEYNNELLNMVMTKTPIEHNSQMEVEIRGNTLYVLELIKNILKKQNVIINSVELDNIIWRMRNNINSDIPVHQTESIYY